MASGGGVGEAFLRAILDSAPDFIARVTLDGGFLYINRTFPELGIEDITRHTIWEFAPPGAVPAMKACFARVIASGESDSYEADGIGPNGRLAQYHTRVSPIRAREGGPVEALVLIATDVTELREAEQQLREDAERLAQLLAEREAMEARLRDIRKSEAITEVAGGLGHNIKNMLAVIVPGVDALAARAAGADEIAADVRAACARADALVRELMLLARGRREESLRRPEDLGELVRRALAICTRSLGARVKLSVDIADALPPAPVDAAQLEQALINVLMNARDALVALEEREPQLVIKLRATEPGWLRLVVRDNGCGMDEETRRRAFEPFFTTKQEGMGTGLGLATVFGVVREHGGMIEIESAPGRGTAVILLLPTGEAAAEETPSSVDATILLVEDEEMLARATARVLGEAGYRVVHAADGSAALRALGDGAREAALVLLDQSLPGRSGRALVDELLALRPGLPIVHFSGHAVSRELAQVISATIAKPVSAETLLGTVRSVLARRGG